MAAQTQTPHHKPHGAASGLVKRKGGDNGSKPPGQGKGNQPAGQQAQQPRQGGGKRKEPPGGSDAAGPPVKKKARPAAVSVPGSSGKDAGAGDVGVKVSTVQPPAQHKHVRSSGARPAAHNQGHGAQGKSHGRAAHDSAKTAGGAPAASGGAVSAVGKRHKHRAKRQLPGKAEAVAAGAAGASAPKAAAAGSDAGKSGSGGGKQEGSRAAKRRKKHNHGGGPAAGPATTAAAAAVATASVRKLSVTTTTALPEKGRSGNSNWEALKTVIGATGEGARRKAAAAAAATAAPRNVGSTTGVTPVIAIDCEMVGVGPGGTRSALARVCVVNNDGNVLVDKYVQPKERVTDYRTRYSGIRPADLVGAASLEEVAAEVAALTKGRTLVGHAIRNDLDALLLSHPKKDIRDTARYPPLMRSLPGRKPKPRALKALAAEQLGLTIQEGEHSPVDDARAALYLYHKHKNDWERALRDGSLRAALAPRLVDGAKVVSRAGQRVRLKKVAGAGAGAAAAAGSERGGPKGAAGAAGVAKKRRPGGMIDFMKRDVRDDPMADL